jgi:putative ABC transport system substrate-binding protein
MPLSDNDHVAQQIFSAFKESIAKLRWIEGRTIAIESRYSEGKPERLPELAAQLVQSKIEVLVAWAAQAIEAARGQTSTIPIVMAGVGDALGAGYISSLAHPGGNTTGLTLAATDQSPKRLQFIQDVMPDVKRVAVIWNNKASGHRYQMKYLEPAAASVTVTLQSLPVLSATEIDAALQSARDADAQAVIVMEDPMIQSNRVRIADFAKQRRWPIIGEFKPIVDAGGLMSYGPDNTDLWRRAAGYVDKILRGARPGDIPVEQPIKFEMVINLKTAKEIGIGIPQLLLAQATEVVE